MLNIEEINEEIEKLEHKEYLTYDICEKLAILYTVRNNYKPKTIATTPTMDMSVIK